MRHSPSAGHLNGAMADGWCRTRSALLGGGAVAVGGLFPLTGALLRLAMRFAPAGIVAMSFLLWGGHLFQFWLFARALGLAIPLIENMAFATLSLLAGLVPLTAVGTGTRDAAIVGLYGPFLGQAAGGGSGGSCHLALSHTGTGRAAVPARLLAP